MIKFLIEMKHEKASETADYKFENVNFKWQTTKSDLDCGVYMMHHIKHFNGVAYSYPDMSKVNYFLCIIIKKFLSFFVSYNVFPFYRLV